MFLAWRMPRLTPEGFCLPGFHFVLFCLCLCGGKNIEALTVGCIVKLFQIEYGRKLECINGSFTVMFMKMLTSNLLLSLGMSGSNQTVA